MLPVTFGENQIAIFSNNPGSQINNNPATIGHKWVGLD